MITQTNLSSGGNIPVLEISIRNLGFSTKFKHWSLAIMCNAQLSPPPRRFIFSEFWVFWKVTNDLDRWLEHQMADKRIWFILIWFESKTKRINLLPANSPHFGSINSFCLTMILSLSVEITSQGINLYLADQKIF